MKFREAVAATPTVENAFQDGLQAILPRDRRRMSQNRTRITGSINLDEATSASYPNSSRWDYGIALEVNSNNDKIAWVEVHPAMTRNVTEMIKKIQWLKQWIKKDAPQIKQLKMAGFHWISTAGVHITNNSPQSRMLAPVRNSGS